MFSGSTLVPPLGLPILSRGLIYTGCPNSLLLFLSPAAKVATLNLHVHDRGNKLNFTVPSTYRDLACRQLLKLRSAVRSEVTCEWHRGFKNLSTQILLAYIVSLLTFLI